MLLSSLDTRRTLVHLFLFKNSAQRVYATAINFPCFMTLHFTMLTVFTSHYSICRKKLIQSGIYNTNLHHCYSLQQFKERAELETKLNKLNSFSHNEKGNPSFIHQNFRDQTYKRLIEFRAEVSEVSSFVGSTVWCIAVYCKKKYAH